VRNHSIIIGFLLGTVYNYAIVISYKVGFFVVDCCGGCYCLHCINYIIIQQI